MILRDETQILNKTKDREAWLENVAKQLAGRLSPDDLRRLITAGHASTTLRDWNGWLRRVLEAETWHEELRR